GKLRVTRENTTMSTDLTGSADYREVIDGEHSIDASGTIIVQSERGKINVCTKDHGTGHIFVTAGATFSLVCGDALFAIYNPESTALQPAEEAEGDALLAASLATDGEGSVSGVVAKEGEDVAEDAGEEEAEEALPTEVVLDAGLEGIIAIQTGEAEVGPSII